MTAGLNGNGQCRLTLWPKQARALHSKAEEILYGGAAGGGKSHLMRVAAIIWSCQIPLLQVGLFRRLYPDLVRNHIEGPHGFRVLLAPLVASGRAAVTNKEVQFWNGSKIYLCHCQDDRALSKYLGQEFHVILFDELTHFTKHQYDFIRGRLRATGINIPRGYQWKFPRIVCGSNPGSIGHHWVREAFVDHGTGLHRAPKDEGGMLRQFIPARLEDNPSLMRDDPGYEDRLEGLGDPMLVKMLREGDWEVVAGSMFGNAWRKGRHICAPFPIPLGWELWRGADDGFSAPAACYWFAQDPDAGTIYVIDELYKAGMLPGEYAERVLARDMAIELMDYDGSLVLNDRVLVGMLDSAAFSDTGQNTKPRGDQMNALGCRWKPVDKWPGSRIARVQNFHRILAPNDRDPEKLPGIRFFDTCKNAIRTIPALPRNDKEIEDVDTDAEDHAFDGVTYGLQYKRPGVKKKRLGGV